MESLKINGHNDISNGYYIKINKSKSEKSYFKERNSLLIDLHENNHFQAIYRFGIAILLIIYIKSLLNENLEGKINNYGLTSFFLGFNDFQNVLLLWPILFGLTLMTYPAFIYWAKKRNVHHLTSPKDLIIKVWDFFWIFVFIFDCVLMFFIPLYLRGVPGAIANNLILLGEETRFVMKMHAFIRTNAPKAINYDEIQKYDLKLPTFSQFLYFLFAPTLIYQDEYPRTKNIHWTSIFWLVLEFAAGVIWFSLVTDNLREIWQDFGLKPETWTSLALLYISTMYHGTFFMMTIFFVLLHTWLNIWAEILCFADRLFYEDWWNSKTYRRFYQTWNLVVHAYLHTYVYKDIIKLVKNKVIAYFLVILISAVVHEIIISFTLGFFLPILFIQYVIFSFPLSLLQNGKTFPKLINFSLLLGIIMNLGAMIYFLTMEFYARKNCGKEHENFSDYFKLRLFTCNGFGLNKNH